MLAQLPPELPEPKSYNTHEDLLGNKEVDAVLIAAPDHLHVSIAHNALSAGKHIYLEKPTMHLTIPSSLLFSRSQHPDGVIPLLRWKHLISYLEHAVHL